MFSCASPAEKCETAARRIPAVLHYASVVRVVRPGYRSMGAVYTYAGIDSSREGGANGTGMVEPVLKWPGGKRGLVPNLLPLLPSRYGSYHEPFLGGAALFFALRPAAARLSDANAELIECYQQIRDQPEELIARLQALNNSESEYYRIRNLHPDDPTGRAARLIYLTTLSFNGLYRVNLKGDFNVPYGHKTHLTACQPERIRAASETLASAALRCSDFEAAVNVADAGDLIYLDPPYTVAHSNNGFLKYNQTIFSWADQVRLARVAQKLVDHGCYVVVSNAAHDSIDALYPEFRRVRVQRASVIAASRNFRRAISESVFVGGTTWR